MTCSYASFARDLTALNAGLTIAVTSGGGIAVGTSRWIACQIRTRGGLTLHTTPVQVTTTSGNQTISVTIAASAIETGDYPMELIISGAATNDVTQMVRLASWRFRDGKTITYTGVGAVVYPGEGTARSLPHTVTLTQDAHVALSASVAAAANLPVTTNLVQGMLRQITATSEVVVYDAEATSGLYAAATGYWKLHLPGFTPINNGLFSTYYGTKAELEGGSDRLVTELGVGQAINLPAYKFDGSTQDPPLILFLNNGLEIEGGSPLPKGGSLEIQIKMNDSDVSSAFAGRISLQLLGYVNRETGELDTSMAGSADIWQPGTGAVTLPEDLPRGFAAAYSVALIARKDEILNDRDFNTSALADGAVLSTLLYFGGSLGYLSDLWYLLGNTILPIDDRMILVPLVNGLRRLGGVALVEGYATRKIGTYLVDGVLEDTADQQATISAALNGAIVMRPDGEELAETEALRAIVSTTTGTQSPSEWSSSFSLTSGNQTISITAISPTAIRSDYPDVLLAGNSQGENNVPYYRVYVEAPGPTIYELNTPATVSPTGTTTITIASLGDLSAASLSTSPNASFGLFGYGSVTGAAAAGGTLATGNYRVAIANFYPSPNPEVTAIAHGDIEILESSVSDLLNQSLPYARLADSFVQPSVSGSVVVEVDNARVFAVGGSVIINSASLVLQGGYEVTAKTDTTLTLTNLGATGSASPGATVPTSGFVYPAGAAGPEGPKGDAATVTVGTVDTVAAGQPATVANSGTASAAVLDFEIPAGTDGADGISGFGLRFTFSTSTGSGPSSGQLRFNNATYASVTSIFVSETDRNLANISALLAAIVDGSLLLVLDDNDSSAFAYFTLTSQADNGGDRTLTVTHIASAGTLSGSVSLTFAAKGDPGDDGDPGLTGTVSAASGLTLEHIATPSAPAAGNTIIYAKSDDLLYYRPAGGTETVVGSGSGGGPGREILAANRTYYVRADGSDSNNGLINSSGGAFATIQKAIDAVAALDMGIYNATISIADGTYTANNSLKTLIGAGKCIIQGNTTTPASVLINTSGTCFDGDYFAGRYEFAGLKLQSSSGSAIFIRGPQSVVEFRDMDFGACASGVHLPIYDGAFCFPIGNYTISGNAAIHFNPQSTAIIDATRGSSAITCTLSGTRNFSAGFCYADRGGQFVGGTAYLNFVGSATGTRYFVLKNAVIDVLGAGVNYFPGNGSSSPSSGGQYT